MTYQEKEIWEMEQRAKDFMKPQFSESTPTLKEYNMVCKCNFVTKFIEGLEYGDKKCFHCGARL